MKAIKSMMMAAALPLVLSMAAPVMAADNNTGTTATLTTPQTAARPAKRRAVRRAVVKKAVAEKTCAMPMAKKEVKWAYTAKRMRPPKSKKWQGRWNDMGHEGWELVAMSENMYIFKRPNDFPLTASIDSRSLPKGDGTAMLQDNTKDAKKAAAAADKAAQAEAKASMKADQQAARAAEKAAAQAAKSAQKEAKAAEKAAAKAAKGQ